MPRSLTVAFAVEEPIRVLTGGCPVDAAVVCCECLAVPVLGFVAVHGESTPPAWCAVAVVVNESLTSFLVGVAVATLGGVRFFTHGYWWLPQELHLRVSGDVRFSAGVVVRRPLIADLWSQPLVVPEFCRRPDTTKDPSSVDRSFDKHCNHRADNYSSVWRFRVSR